MFNSVFEPKVEEGNFVFVWSENGTGESHSGAGEDSGQGAGGLAAETGSEGAGAVKHEKPDVQPAGRLREPVGRQASSGHGNQCLQEDAGGGGTEVLYVNCGNPAAAEKHLPGPGSFSPSSCEYQISVCNFSLRLQLSPSPSQHTTIPRTHEHSSRKIRGKKRKHEGASGSSPAHKMSSRSTERGAVSVAEVDIDGRYVRLKNNSETVRLFLLFYFFYLNQYELVPFERFQFHFLIQTHSKYSHKGALVTLEQVMLVY